MLTIDQNVYNAIVAHARIEHPVSACGMVAGPIGTDRPVRVVPMANAERSPTFFSFDVVEQLRVWQEMDRRDEEPLVVYHSNPYHEAYPSRVATEELVVVVPEDARPV
jgi:proteasome lid subunit RPN8/RPN11